MARDTQYTLYKTARTDPTFKNIWAFDREDEREAWLNTCSPQPFLNNKYWRVGNTIKCPIRYEESFNYDYVRIVNRDSDSNKRKTWFCFITGRAYISNNCTMFTLAIDYVQTFYWSKLADGGVAPFWHTEGFISKATKPLLPPRGTASEYPVPDVSCYHIDFNATGYSVVIYSSIDIRDLSSLKYVSAIIDGQYTASPPFVMSANVSAISNLINDINTAGYTDAISGIYLVPNDYLNLSLVSTTPRLATDSSLYITIDKVIQKPVSCDGDISHNGYIPENKELLGYDYSYFTINNGQGEVSTWHFEDFDGDPSFSSRLSLASGSPVLILYPNNYINADGNDFRQLSVKITQAPSCSFLNDSYKIWLAQTQNSRAAAINGAVLAINQANEARDKSLNAVLNVGYNNVVGSSLGSKVAQTAENALSAVGSSIGAIPTILSDPIAAFKRMGESMSMESPDSFYSFGAIKRAWQAAGSSQQSLQSQPQNQSSSAVDTGYFMKLGDAYIRANLGIEQAYVYDQNKNNRNQGIGFDCSA